MSTFRNTSIWLSLSTIAVWTTATAEAQQALPRWTGLYAGINGGYGVGSADTSAVGIDTTRVRTINTTNNAVLTETSASTVNALPGFTSVNVDGWVGGGQLGYNWQLGGAVLGLETDFQASNERGSFTNCSVAGCGTGSAFVSTTTKLDWFGTVRGRAGLLLDPKFLMYATAGWAYGQVSNEYALGTFGTWSGVGRQSGVRSGFVVGGGGEWKIDNSWLVRAEYLHMDLGRDDGIAGSGGASASVRFSDNRLLVVDQTTVINARTKFTDDIFRIGLSYQLN